MKQFFGALKDIVGWIFLAFFAVVSLMLMGVIWMLRHDLVTRMGLAAPLSVFAGAAVIASLCLWWLGRSYGIRSTALVFGGLAAATLLYYGEEDWRGGHAWRTFKQHCPARDAIFDLLSLSPPPVPDDQNFAMAPVVVTSYAQMLDRNGNEVVPRNDQIVNRLKTSITAEEGKHPATGAWAAGKLTDLTAWQNYYRTLAATTNLFPVSPQPQSPAADVLLALGKYDSVLVELRAASRLPGSRFPLSYSKPDPAEILLPHLAALKKCAEMLSLRATAELQNHEPEKALADTQLAFQLAGKIRNEPLLISHLVRMAMLQLTLQPVWEGLVEKRWSETQLASLETELSQLDFLPDYELSLHGEQCFGSEIIEYLRQADNPLREAGALTGSLEMREIPPEVFLLVFGPSGWYDQNHVAIATFNQQWYFPMADLEKRTVSPEFVARASLALQTEMKPGNPGCVIGRMVLPGLGVAARKFAHAQASADLARIAIALERYRLANGEFPDALNELTPRFLDSVPHDIIGGQPLHYHLTDQHGFILYSVGWNETDDSGTVSYLNGGISPDITAGDWVWFSQPTGPSQK